MRKIIIFFILTWYFSPAYCQTFKGTVYDRSTDSTISFASIYFSGTSIGTYSDIHGNFELDISKYNSMPITISMLGYYSVSLSEHGSNKKYDIYLSPKLNLLKEVIVKANGKRKTYLRIFKREFLGETENARDCNIINEDDLRFVYYADSNVLKAYSSKPILIQNNALGYTITYYMDKFKYNRRIGTMGELIETSTIIGNYLFKDNMISLNEYEKVKVEERRKSAYFGSRMQFFRLLYQGNIVQSGENNILLNNDSAISEGFIIGSKSTITCSSIISKKDSLSGYLKNKGELSVSYKWKNSSINVKEDSVYFEKDGYYDPFGAEFSGEISKQRIGDLLPFEYSLK